jgi:thymidylate synthase ThyX
MFEAKIILDSICNGQRLTTMQVTHPRIVHSEFMTHAMFARNASSSRAIPFKKTVQKVMEDPFIPEHWGINQYGMQAAEELTGAKREHAIAKWLEARDESVRLATEMASQTCLRCEGSGKVSNLRLNPMEHINVTCPDCDGDGLGLNVHKQIVNRLIEPWSWITVCVTGDAAAWSNYFALRCHPDAQPDIQKQAYMAQKEYFSSVPQVLQAGQWHAPYIRTEEIIEIKSLHGVTKCAWELEKEQGYHDFDSELVVKISTGRCARTSYLTQEGSRDYNEDIKLHDRLRYHTPLHASPFEHVCQAKGDNVRYAKYTGWKAYRHMLKDEYVTNFKPNHPDLVTA